MHATTPPCNDVIRRVCGASRVHNEVSSGAQQACPLRSHDQRGMQAVGGRLRTRLPPCSTITLQVRVCACVCVDVRTYQRDDALCLERHELIRHGFHVDARLVGRINALTNLFHKRRDLLTAVLCTGHIRWVWSAQLVSAGNSAEAHVLARLSPQTQLHTRGVDDERRALTVSHARGVCNIIVITWE